MQKSTEVEEEIEGFSVTYLAGNPEGTDLSLSVHSVTGLAVDWTTVDRLSA